METTKVTYRPPRLHATRHSPTAGLLVRWEPRESGIHESNGTRPHGPVLGPVVVIGGDAAQGGLLAGHREGQGPVDGDVPGAGDAGVAAEDPVTRRGSPLALALEHREVAQEVGEGVAWNRDGEAVLGGAQRVQHPQHPVARVDA